MRCPSPNLAPFDATTAWEDSLIPFCVDWPDASSPPRPTATLPNVPTLILSGTQDLRTPTSGARQVASEIPDAQLLVVPYTGHSVLGSDFSGCARSAVEAFFSGTAVKACSAAKNLFSPTPVTPTKLAYVKPVPGLAGKPGRTLTAALDTMVDLSRQVIGATLQADQELPSGSSFGGLHGGYARFTAGGVELHGFTFVTGVSLTGKLPVLNGEIRPATITITGTVAAGGSVKFGTSQRVSGTLGGHRFNLSVAKVKLSSASHAGWPSRPVTFPLGALAHIR